MRKLRFELYPCFEIVTSLLFGSISHHGQFPDEEFLHSICTQYFSSVHLTSYAICISEALCPKWILCFQHVRESWAGDALPKERNLYRMLIYTCRIKKLLHTLEPCSTCMHMSVTIRGVLFDYRPLRSKITALRYAHFLILPLFYILIG